MTTELQTNGKHGVELTRHAGGDKGMCVQLTGWTCDGERGWLSVSRQEAEWIAYDLLQFSGGHERDHTGETT